MLSLSESHFWLSLQERIIWLGWLWQNVAIEAIFANIFCLSVFTLALCLIGHLRERGNLITGGMLLILLSFYRATWWRNTLKLTAVPKCSLQTEHCRSCAKEDWIRYCSSWVTRLWVFDFYDIVFPCCYLELLPKVTSGFLTSSFITAGGGRKSRLSVKASAVFKVVEGLAVLSVSTLFVWYIAAAFPVSTVFYCKGVGSKAVKIKEKEKPV